MPREDTASTLGLVLDRLEGIDGKVTTLDGKVTNLAIETAGIKATLDAHGREIGRLAEVCDSTKDGLGGLTNRVVGLEAKRSMAPGAPASSNGNGRLVSALRPYFIPLVVAVAILVVYAMSAARGDSDDVIQQRLNAITNIAATLANVQKDVQAIKADEAKSESAAKAERVRIMDNEDKAAAAAAPVAEDGRM